MALIPQVLSENRLLSQQGGIVVGDTMQRSPLFPVKVVSTLKSQVTTATATVRILAGGSATSTPVVLETLTLSYFDPTGSVTVRSTYPFISADITAISGTGSNVTVLAYPVDI